MVEYYCSHSFIECGYRARYLSFAMGSLNKRQLIFITNGRRQLGLFNLSLADIMNYFYL